MQSVLQGWASRWGVKCCITEGRCENKVLFGFFHSPSFLIRHKAALRACPPLGNLKVSHLFICKWWTISWHQCFNPPSWVTLLRAGLMAQLEWPRGDGISQVQSKLKVKWCSLIVIFRTTRSLVFLYFGLKGFVYSSGIKFILCCSPLKMLAALSRKEWMRIWFLQKNEFQQTSTSFEDLYSNWEMSLLLFHIFLKV